MSIRDLLVTVVLILGIVAGLVYSKDRFEKKLVYENKSFNELQMEVQKYKSLKSVDKSKADLKQSIQEISKLRKPSNIHWQGDKVILYFNQMPKNLIDRITQTFFKKGHFIESLIVKKSGDNMYLELGVNP